MPMIGRSEAAIVSSLQFLKELSVYCHIPFCRQKCHYCHFFVIKNHPILEKEWFDKIMKEIDFWQSHLSQQLSLPSLYFGGGTPSSIAPEMIGAVIEKWSPYLRSDAEITVEVNPENASTHLFQTYKRFGVNRLSFGVQTFQDSSLQDLGRTHGTAQAIHGVNIAREIGFPEVSIDIMCDLPDQRMEHLPGLLKAIESLPITHLSLYNLQIEPQTNFFRRRHEVEQRLPREEDSSIFYQTFIAELERNGWKRYEISAFRKGNPSCHNLGYWRGRSYLGLGPSAHSFIDNYRFAQPSTWRDWLTGVNPIHEDYVDHISNETRQRELFLILLRVLDPELSYSESPLYQPPFTEKEMNPFIERGWIYQKGDRYFLTPKGAQFYDYIATELI